MPNNLKKVISLILVLIMIFTNLLVLGNSVVRAEAVNLTSRSTSKKGEVSFDTYFSIEGKYFYANTLTIGKEFNIIASIKVEEEGYIQEGKISIDKDSNFKFGEVNLSQVVQATSETEIVTNRITSKDKEIQIAIPIKFNRKENVKVSDFNKINDVIFSGVFVNKEGKEKEVEAKTQLQVMWEAKATPIFESNITKYVPFNLNNSKGILIQEEIKAGVENNSLPIGKEEIKVIVPTINNTAPVEVNVTGTDNFGYNVETKTLTINNDRKVDSDGNIIWQEELDKFNVTYKYDEKALNTESNEISISFKGELKLSVYKNIEEVLTKNYTTGLQLKDPISSIVGFELTPKENISKGYMYANYDKTSGKNETEYKETVKVTIGDTSLTDSVSVTLNADKLGGTIDLAEKIKSLTIKEDSLKMVLGKEGKIDIYSKNELIGTLNETNQTIDLTAKNIKEGLTLKLSKPTEVGNVEIEVVKAISGDQNFSKEQLQQITNISSSITGVAYSGNFEFINETKTTKINMTEPKTQALLSFDNQTLSTLVKNEDVKIKAILRNDSLDNKLFKNPLINITLPDCVTNIDIKSVDILYDNELKLTGYTIHGKTIVIQLEGTQTNYNLNSISLGTNIIITAAITVDRLATTQYPEIPMIYVNDGEELETSAKLPIIAPIGLVTVNEVREGAETYTALIGDPKTIILDTDSIQKNITVEGKIINNYENPISSIKVVGEVPNKELNANMNSGIKLDTPADAKTYYSTKSSPTKDLNKAENEWTETPQDLTKVKSYMIVLNNLTMNQGYSIGFSYGVTIGEGLSYNQEGKAKYSVYFDNNLETGKVEDKATSEDIKLSTGIKIDLSGSLVSNIEEETIVHEGDYIDFQVIVTNNGDTDIKNVSVNAIAPNGTLYKYIENGDTKYEMNSSVEGATKIAEIWSTIIEYDGTDKNNPESEFGSLRNISVGDLKEKQSIRVSYTIRLDKVLLYSNDNSDNSNGVYLPIVANINALKLDDSISTNQTYIKVKPAELKVKNTSSVAQTRVLGQKKEIKYTTTVKAWSIKEDLKNFNFEFNLPNGITILEANITGKDGDTRIEGNTVKFTASNFTKNDSIKADIKVRLDSIEGIFSPNIKAYAEGTDVYTGDIIYLSAEKTNVTIEQKQLDNQYIKEGEEVIFTFYLTNNGESTIEKLTFVEKIPEEFTYKSAEIYQNDTTMPIYETGENGSITYTIKDLFGKTSAKIDITMVANRIPDGKSQIVSTNEATIVEEKSGMEIKSNPVNIIIEYSEENHSLAPAPQGSAQVNYYNQYVNSNPGTYKISGTAWIDANKNGTIDSGEAKLPNINVTAINQEDTSKIYNTTTSNEGTYEFSTLPAGKYIIAFNYDSSKYTVTAYKVVGVAESINNDTISGQTTINGVLQIVAISDILTLNGDNIRNINLGVYDSRISDLSLDKIVSSITVSNETGTANYKYEGNNRKLAKRELTPSYIDSTNIQINYEITVKNEGNVTEYVRKIADYLPKDLTFNEELNSGWYEAQNGLLINDSLANIALNPGEAKTIKLVLTQSTSNDKLGIINNAAEIYESYNEEGIKEADSTVANKATKEDDYSSADVILAIRTGAEEGTFVGITLLVLVIIGAGAYLIKKKSDRKEIKE